MTNYFCKRGEVHNISKDLLAARSYLEANPMMMGCKCRCVRDFDFEEDIAHQFIPRRKAKVAR